MKNQKIHINYINLQKGEGNNSGYALNVQMAGMITLSRVIVNVQMAGMITLSRVIVNYQILIKASVVHTIRITRKLGEGKLYNAEMYITTINKQYIGNLK